MKTKKILAANLKAYRKKYKVTQEEIASRAGITRNGYFKIESCKTSARIETLDRLADAIGVSVAQLLTEGAF
jgi:transcriptional regulator with XRE-family HTH domain